MEYKPKEAVWLEVFRDFKRIIAKLFSRKKPGGKNKLEDGFNN